MDSKRWSEIQDVYLEAAELPPKARPAFLRRRCAHDPDLLAEVRSLLAADETGGDLLDAGLDDLVLLLPGDAGSPDLDAPGPGGAPDTGPPSSIPERAGPYQICEEIGRGGMGSVYRAERADGQYDREVALKFVRLDARDPDAARRFQQERRILARLEHPNIARLYDAGVTDDGRPYLAMELVRGEPIHRYCDRGRLSVETRLRLFEQVVAGVDYLHRNLVIHRDLKPSNILVTDDGSVKLLDFGIAKLLSDDAPAGGDGRVARGAGDSDDPLTRVDRRILTPEYASPEQVDGLPLTTAADVYALGVLLHQLLTGRRPEADPRTREIRTAPSAAVGARRSGEPSSSAPGEAGPLDAGQIAHNRDTTPARLRRLLEGDLDTILLKALRTEPEERYPFAAALLEDLVRYRQGRAIRARPPSLGYRAGKFVARHRVPVGFAALAVLALVGGLGVALQQATLARTQADVARQERDVAEAVTGFVQEMLRSSSPVAAGAERVDTLRMSAFVDRAVSRVDSSFADQPRIRAEIQTLLAGVYDNMGRFSDGEPLVDAALATYRDLGLDSGEPVVEAMEVKARLLMHQGARDEARATFGEALGLAEAIHGPGSLRVADFHYLIATSYLDDQRPADAEPHLTSAVEIRRQVYPEVSRERAEEMVMLGAIRFQMGDLEGAASVMAEGLEVITRTLGDTHLNTAIITQNLGLILYRLRRYEEAESLLRRAIDGMTAAVGPAFPPMVGTVKQLATTVNQRGRFAEADSLFREALALARRTQGEASPGVADVQHDFGVALLRRDRLAEAEPLLEGALTLHRTHLGPDAERTLASTLALGSLRRKQNRLAEAEELTRTAAQKLRDRLPAAHPRVLEADLVLSRLLVDQGRREEARGLLEEAYDRALTTPDGGLMAQRAADELAHLHRTAQDEAAATLWERRAEEHGAGVSPPAGTGTSSPRRR